MVVGRENQNQTAFYDNFPLNVGGNRKESRPTSRMHIRKRGNKDGACEHNFIQDSEFPGC